MHCTSTVMYIFKMRTMVSHTIFHQAHTMINFSGVQDPSKVDHLNSKCGLLEPQPLNIHTNTPFWPILWQNVDLLADLEGVLHPLHSLATSLPVTPWHNWAIGIFSASESEAKVCPLFTCHILIPWCQAI